MNKKAQIPTILVYVLAIAASLVALFAMVSFNDSLDTQSQELSELMFDISFNENYVKNQVDLIFRESLVSCQSCTAERLKEIIIQNAQERESLNRYEGAGNLYAKLRNREFEIENNENIHTLKISDLFVQAEKGYSKMQRNFNLSIKSNSQKDL